MVVTSARIKVHMEASSALVCSFNDMSSCFSLILENSQPLFSFFEEFLLSTADILSFLRMY